MVLLKESLLSLQYCGMWAPGHLDSKCWKYKAYNVYTIFIVFVMYWFTSSELINLLVTTGDVDDFSDTCFMLLSTLAICAKIFITLRKKSDIRAILTALERYPHKPMNVEEQTVQDKFDKQIRFLTLFYGIATEMTVWCMTIFAFFQEIPFGTLPYKAWVPYDYSGSKMYWFTYYQQLFSVVLAANLDIGFDTIIPGFILQICAQFNILKCRLRRVINEVDFKELGIKSNGGISWEDQERRIGECIKYHRAIMKMAHEINSIFMYIIFFQYTASCIIICASVLLISQMPLFSPQFTALFMYLSCMLMQIFMFCATGNEATIQCQNVITGIWTTKWYLLNNRMKKSLILMMVRTLRPIKFVCGHIVVLSLDSFCILIKYSYSAYTVLQRSAS